MMECYMAFKNEVDLNIPKIYCQMKNTKWRGSGLVWALWVKKGKDGWIIYVVLYIFYTYILIIYAGKLLLNMNMEMTGWED